MDIQAFNYLYSYYSFEYSGAYCLQLSPVVEFNVASRQTGIRAYGQALHKHNTECIYLFMKYSICILNKRDDVSLCENWNFKC